jgi:hypothetical protein
VYFARGWYVNNRKSIGKGTVITPLQPQFDLWQGPAPRVNTEVTSFIITGMVLALGYGEALNNGSMNWM